VPGSIKVEVLPEIEPFQERIGARLALVCDINIAGKTIRTYNLHLESKGDDAFRCLQLNDNLTDAQRCNGNTPILVAGDFNLDVSKGTAATALSRAHFRMPLKITI
jgi:endonuclease/exonuclease/phosphatase family metal-dependent hydrolase